jgi:hypothetical protein
MGVGVHREQNQVFMVYFHCQFLLFFFACMAMRLECPGTVHCFAMMCVSERTLLITTFGAGKTWGLYHTAAANAAANAANHTLHCNHAYSSSSSSSSPSRCETHSTVIVAFDERFSLFGLCLSTKKPGRETAGWARIPISDMSRNSITSRPPRALGSHGAEACGGSHLCGRHRRYRAVATRSVWKVVTSPLTFLVQIRTSWRSSLLEKCSDKAVASSCPTLLPLPHIIIYLFLPSPSNVTLTLCFLFFFQHHHLLEHQSSPGFATIARLYQIPIALFTSPNHQPPVERLRYSPLDT